MIEWQTAIIDRTESDVIFADANRSNLDENIGARDYRFFNRIANNMRYIRQELIAKGYRRVISTLESPESVDKEQILLHNDVKKYQRDIERVRNVLYIGSQGEPITPITPELSWNNFEKWNDIEQIIYDVKLHVETLEPIEQISKEIGEVGMTYRSFAPVGCSLLPTVINEESYPQLFEKAFEEISRGNTLYVLAGSTITIKSPQFPVAFNPTDTDFDILGKQGGAKTHTLTTAQMPRHTHVQNSHNHTQNSHTHTQNPHEHNTRWSSDTSTGTGGGVRKYDNANIQQRSPNITSSTVGTNEPFTGVNVANTATNNNTGGNQAHDNLPIFTTVNFWICHGEDE